MAEPCDKHPGQLKKCCYESCARAAQETAGTEDRDQQPNAEGRSNLVVSACFVPVVVPAADRMEISKLCRKVAEYISTIYNNSDSTEAYSCIL